MKAKRVFLATALAATFGLAQTALADTIRHDGLAFGSAGAFTLNDATPAALGPKTVSAGALSNTNMTGPTYPAGTSFMAWCLNAFTPLLNTTDYTLQSGASFYSGASAYIATDLMRLASYVFDNTTTAFSNAGFAGGASSTVQSSAFQLAAWEIINDSGGTGTYNITSGDFNVSSGDAGTLALSNNWLSVVNSGSYAISQDLGVWVQDCASGNCTQDLGVFTSMIPEPETYAMLLAGLGLMGFVARRRKQK